MSNLSINNPSVRSIIIRNAVILTVFGIVFSWGVTYLMSTIKNPIFMGLMGLLLFGLVIFVTVYCIRKAVISVRDTVNDGKITFGKAFEVGFITNLIAFLLQTAVFAILVITLRDFYIGMQVEMLENSADFMIQNKVDGAEIEKIYDQIDVLENTSAGKLIVDTMWKGLVFSFILPLIIAAAIKKEKFNTNASTL